MRRSDAEGLSGRHVPFYVPGEPSGSKRWRRDAVRYVSLEGGSNRPQPKEALPSPPSVKPARVGILAGLAFLLIIVAALVGFVVSSNEGPSRPAMKGDSVLATTVAAISEVKSVSQLGLVNESNAMAGFTYDLNPRDLFAIAGTADVAEIDLKDGPTSSQAVKFDVSDVRSALARIEESGDCGFVLVDANTGHGLVYNATEEMYVASAAKAPFVYWLLTSGLELDEFDEEEVAWVVTESDNSSFEDLFLRYYEYGYEEFMRARNVRHDDYYSDFYPRMSARSLAGIWAEILQYVQEGSEDALVFGAHLAATETSFIRDGLFGTDALVLNKAGWIDEESYSYDGSYGYDGEDSDSSVGYESNGDAWAYRSVSDAGIIQADGHTYLMAIATSQPDSDEDEANVSALARALFDVRAKM